MARYVAAWLLPALAILASVALAPPGELSAQTPTASANAQGVRPDAVVFGQSCALSGPAKALGEGMRLGIAAAFEEANRAGGIHGRQLRLETRDDRYEPEAAIANTNHLIGEKRVFALIGAVGTPTSKAAEPIATEAGVPYVGAFTGAEFLRDARRRPTVINVRASYYQETEEMVERLTRDLGVQRIGILYQDDSYGRAGLAGTLQALHRRGMTLVAEATYPRNTRAVKTAVLDLREGRPEAVIIVGAYEPVAEFIKWSRYLDFNPVFVNISFVGSSALARALGPSGENVIVTQVVPFPHDRWIPVVGQYHEALRAVAASAEPGFVSLEGYLTGRVAVEALRRAGPNPTREGFIRALQKAGTMDLGGFLLLYGESDNQGSDRVYLTVIDGSERFRSIRHLERP
ncbi:MAG: ABC transporter substrate-binding protein [Deltaproteobacteria bacterium]|nr:ABC transporter substrate-binding protein [Deltaproteobacteria bacterium]